MRNTSGVIVAILLAAGAAACTTANSSGSPGSSPVGSAPRPASASLDPRLATVDAAEARWVARRPSTYAFTYTHHGPAGLGWDWRYRVTALDGHVQAHWMDGYAQSDGESERMSVEGAFALLRQELGGSGDLAMTFDPDLGYPTEIAYADRAIADSEGTESVTDFVSRTNAVAANARKVVESARATWKRWEPTAYEYVWRVSVAAAGPTSGTAWDVRYADGRTSTEADATSDGALPAEAASVTATFDAVDAALDAGAWVDVTLAPSSGLPVLVAVDPSPDRTGDEYWIRFTFRDTAREVATNDLQAAQGRWLAAGLQHFSYTWRYRGKYRPLTYGVTYDGDASALRRDPGTPIPEASGTGPRIDDTFALIRDVLSQGGRVNATYDPVLGYPVRVELDPFGDIGAPGTITIKAFEVH